MISVTAAPITTRRATPAARPLGRVAVLGGGIAGLASAHFLTRAGARVSLFEASDQVGGLGTFFRHGDLTLDRFYHCILPLDADLLALLEELGLREQVYWTETSLGFLHRRRLYSLNGPLDLLRFGAARPLDRLRLGTTALYATYVARPDELDDVTVVEWLTRLSGPRAFDALWRPLLEAKFGDGYRHIPALWYWASFNREKGLKREVKGYLRGGYKGIADRLVHVLRRAGVKLHLNSPVEHVDLAPQGQPQLRVRGTTIAFDRVVCTLPIPLLRRVAAESRLAPALNGVAADLDYQGVQNVLLLLKRPLTRHYWIPVVDSGVPFQGIVETTRILQSSEAGGHHLVYLLNYLHRTHPLYLRAAEDVERDAVHALLDLFPQLSRADVTASFLFRAPFVEPLYSPGYARRKPPAELVPGRVYLATAAQVYPRVTSWNSSTAVARATVAELVRRAEVEA